MIRSLTLHELVFYGDDDEVYCRVPSEGIARAKATITRTGEYVTTPGGATLPVVESVYGETVGLPDPEEGTDLVVSLVTTQAARAAGRTTDDLLLLQELVRDEGGRVIGARSLSRL